jgi:hypothetical protein
MINEAPYTHEINCINLNTITVYSKVFFSLGILVQKCKVLMLKIKVIHR